MIEDVCAKTCANCKHFKRYYVLNVSLRFKPIDKGFCTKRKMRRSGRQTEVMQDATCELWQTNELEKLKDQYAAENILQSISDKLEAVRILLSEDKNT